MGAGGLHLMESGMNLVKRLRSMNLTVCGERPCDEAADRIEQLEAQLAAAEQRVNEIDETCMRLEYEKENLQAKYAELENGTVRLRARIKELERERDEWNQQLRAQLKAQAGVPDAYPALQALTEAILTKADADYMQRQLEEAVRIMAARGWSPPVPFSAAPTPTTEAQATTNELLIDAQISSNEAQAVSSEPVGYLCSDAALIRIGYKRISDRCEGAWNIPLYTTPPNHRAVMQMALDVIESECGLGGTNTYDPKAIVEALKGALK